ncbi:MAG: radical SAM/Cys-rich domain protein [Candidatus Glassbacteria bacterium]|nr:radical SAM/Cys-rich domain protein [Candidatus Glassbacteria bacterium]
MEVKTRTFDFKAKLREHKLKLNPVSIETLQVNIGKLCNQFCRHCHVDASPLRTELMDLRTVDACLEVLGRYGHIGKLDITGGAPELNPHFDYLVREARKLDKHVMVRHNLTVTLDGNPQTGEKKEYLPDFFHEQQVEVISSLPYYSEYFTDNQRGKGVFKKSIESMRRLNARGFGVEGSGLQLSLVYNPVGTYLPASQKSLEADFKRELKNKFGLSFNRLFTITNMPINRFRKILETTGSYEEYMEKLWSAFNPSAAEGVMCRSLVSVSYDGKIYDCDFNQMLEMQMTNGVPATIYDFDLEKLLERQIRFASHCFGCTAGAGSSCTGETT